MVELIVSLLLLAPLVAAVVLIARGQLLRGLAIPTGLALAGALLNWIVGGGAATWITRKPDLALAVGGVSLAVALAIWLRGLYFHRGAFRRVRAALEGHALSSMPVDCPAPTLEDRWIGAGAPLRAMRPQRLDVVDERPEAEASALAAILEQLPHLKAEDNASQAIWAQLSTAGLLGLGVPTDFGGKGLRPGVHSDLVATAAQHSLFVAESLAASGPGSAADLIDAFGSGEQRRALLPLLASGELFIARAWDGDSVRSMGSATAVASRKGRPPGVELSFKASGIELAANAGMVLVVADVHDPDGRLARGDGSNDGPVGPTCFLLGAEALGALSRSNETDASHGLPRGTIRGEGLFVPLSSVLGGPDAIGLGATQVLWSGARQAGWLWPAIASGIASHATDMAVARQLIQGPTSPTSDLSLADAAAHAWSAEAARRSAAQRIDDENLAPSQDGQADETESKGAEPDEFSLSHLRAAGWTSLRSSAASVRAAARALREEAPAGSPIDALVEHHASWPVVAEARAATLEAGLRGTIKAPFGARLSLGAMAEQRAVVEGDLHTYGLIRRRRFIRSRFLKARALRRLLMGVLPSNGRRFARRIKDLGTTFAILNDALAREVPGAAQARLDEIASHLAHAHGGLVGALSLLETRAAEGEQTTASASFDLALEDALNGTARALLAAQASLGGTGDLGLQRLTRSAGTLPAGVKRALSLDAVRDLERHHDLGEPPMKRSGHGTENTAGRLLRAASLSRSARGALEAMERAAARKQLDSSLDSNQPTLHVAGHGVTVEQLDAAVQVGLISELDRGCVIAADEARRVALGEALSGDLGGDLGTGRGDRARTSA